MRCSFKGRTAVRTKLKAEMSLAALQVAFVAEDPTPDTPGSLRNWLDQIDRTFVGLMGGNTASRQMAETLYQPPAVVAPESPTEGKDGNARGGGGSGDDGHTSHRHGGAPYSVEHSTAVYVFGPGDEAVLYSMGAAPGEYAADFARLLSSSEDLAD